jgi:hypothetical protein
MAGFTFARRSSTGTIRVSASAGKILQRVEFRKRSGRDDAADDASDNAATRIH